MQTLKAAALYFVLVFGAGFVLGPVRVLWAEPRLGERVAKLLEMPIMMVVIVAAARWVVRHCKLRGEWRTRMGVGVTALALLLAAEFGFAFYLRGLSPREYLSTQDSVAGPIYYVVLVLYALMPWALGLRRTKPG